MVPLYFQSRRVRRYIILLPLVACLSLLATAQAKEIIATYEWQKLGPTDTVQAGLEIRMDLGGGGKWARLPPPSPQEEDAPSDQQQQPQQQVVPVHHKDRCGPSCKERQKERAEMRRAAGFRLREPTHKDSIVDSWKSIAPNDNDTFSILIRCGIFIVLGLIIGVWVTTRLRSRNANNGLHEH